MSTIVVAVVAGRPIGMTRRLAAISSRHVRRRSSWIIAASAEAEQWCSSSALGRQRCRESRRRASHFVPLRRVNASQPRDALLIAPTTTRGTSTSPKRTMAEAQYKDYLAARVLVEQKPVTYRLLSRAVNTDVNTAKWWVQTHCTPGVGHADQLQDALRLPPEAKCQETQICPCNLPHHRHEAEYRAYYRRQRPQC